MTTYELEMTTGDVLDIDADDVRFEGSFVVFYEQRSLSDTEEVLFAQHESGVSAMYGPNHERALQQIDNE